MAGQGKSQSVRAPLMRAFRAAHEANDAKRHEDQRDEAGERVLAGRRSIGRNAITEGELQVAVSQDLESLMNTTNLGSAIDLGEFSEVARSVLNYGLPDIVHRTIHDVSRREVGREVEAALKLFEPRLDPGSISVVPDTGRESADLKVSFRVRGALRYDTYHVPVEFVADLERDTGKISIART